MTEKDLHKQICTYLKYQYPKVIFNSDMSGIKLTIGQAVQLKSLRSSRAYPDIIVLKPNKTHYALFMEVKKESPFKKDGTLKKNEHLEEQKIMIEKLNELGYFAKFVWSFDMAKQLIDEYLKKL